VRDDLLDVIQDAVEDAVKLQRTIERGGDVCQGFGHGALFSFGLPRTLPLCDVSECRPEFCLPTVVARFLTEAQQDIHDLAGARDELAFLLGLLARRNLTLAGSHAEVVDVPAYHLALL